MKLLVFKQWPTRSLGALVCATATHFEQIIGAIELVERSKHWWLALIRRCWIKAEEVVCFSVDSSLPAWLLSSLMIEKRPLFIIAGATDKETIKVLLHQAQNLCACDLSVEQSSSDRVRAVPFFLVVAKLLQSLIPVRYRTYASEQRTCHDKEGKRCMASNFATATS